LVLEQYDIDVEAPERSSRPQIVSARALRDGLKDLGALRARRIVDDDECVAIFHIADAEQRRSHVERKCSDPARPGRIGREDRGTHGCARAPFARSSGGFPVCRRSKTRTRSVPSHPSWPGRLAGRDRSRDRSTGRSALAALRVAVLAPVSWRVPPRHYGPWAQIASL